MECFNSNSKFEQAAMFELNAKKNSKKKKTSKNIKILDIHGPPGENRGE